MINPDPMIIPAIKFFRLLPFLSIINKPAIVKRLKKISVFAASPKRYAETVTSYNIPAI